MKMFKQIFRAVTGVGARFKNELGEFYIVAPDEKVLGEIVADLLDCDLDGARAGKVAVTSLEL